MEGDGAEEKLKSSERSYEKDMMSWTAIIGKRDEEKTNLGKGVKHQRIVGRAVVKHRVHSESSFGVFRLELIGGGLEVSEDLQEHKMS